MKIPFLTTLAILAIAGSASAHEVWLERDAAGPVRVYLGEPAEAVPAGGDPEFSKLKAPKVFTGDVKAPAPIVRKADHLEAAVSGKGDVRLLDDAVFDAWKNDAGAYEGAVFYAREGRTETKAALDLEIVPVTAHGDTFTVLFRGQPLADASVNLINPDKWAKTFKTDARGQLTIPSEWKGRYLLAASHAVDESRALGGQTVAKVYHTSTLTFVK